MEKEKIDILLHEYKFLTSNYNSILGEYRKQVNYLQVYVSIFTGLIYFLFTRHSEIQAIESLEPQYLFATLLVLSVTILYYLFSHVIDVIYNLYLVEGQLSVNEQLINKACGKDLLNYQSKVLKFFITDFASFKGWVNPSWAVGLILTFGFLLLIVGLHGVLAFYWVADYTFKYFFTVLNIIITSYLTFQLLLINVVGYKFIYNHCQKTAGLKPTFSKELKNMKNYNLYFLPFLTFILGFFSFSILSLNENSFWFDTPFDIPLISVFSVSVGDAILLPIINFMTYKLAVILLGVTKLKSYKNEFFRWLVIGIFISLIINVFTHYAWTTDDFTDFIAIEKGTMSLGGWWHLIFSIVEMVIIILFIFLWNVSIKEKNTVAIAYSKKIWKYVFVFSSLMIFNFIYQFFFVFEQPFGEALLSAKFTIFPPLAAILLLFFMNKKEKEIMG